MSEIKFKLTKTNNSNELNVFFLETYNTAKQSHAS